MEYISTPLELECASPMPSWLPDETLFSLASRYHALSGNRLAAHTALALFGAKREGCQHDFPTRIGAFASRAGGSLGEAPSIALNRTILPFYLPLRSATAKSKALKALTEKPEGILKYRLGILTSRFRANHPLKACAACMEEDVASFGTTYWHQAHQFPGVWLCLRHNHALKAATVKSTGVARFGWALPNSQQLLAPSEFALSDAAERSLSQLATLVARWAALPYDTHLSVTNLSRCYRSRLADGVLQSSKRRVKLDEWALAFLETVQPLRSIPELSGLAATRKEATQHIEQWILHTKPNSNTHPLRHLSLIQWLFPSWEAFWTRYLEIESALPEDKPAALPAAKRTDVRKAELLSLMAQGLSSTAAARQVNVAVGTAIAWAAADGVPTPRRPKALKGAVLPYLISDLRAGIDKATVAERHGVSVQAVTRLLRSEVGLQAAWHAKRLRQDQARARSTWLELIATFPGIGITALRVQQPWAYAWLYRNDREWLASQTQSIRLPRTSGAVGRVDWDSRDNALANKILCAASDIAAGTQRTHVALWQLYQAIPELKAKLSALDQLPLTREAIDKVTRARRRRATSAPLL